MQGMTDGDKEARALIALCARPAVSSVSRSQIATRAGRIADWSALMQLAETHGMGPLLYEHLKAAGVELPVPIRRQFQGVYVRHARGNEVRLRVLGEVLEAFEKARVLTTVLKGPFLIDRVYGDPGLRPMSDLDLLVPPDKAIPAQLLLGEMGFAVHVPHTEHRFLRRQHLSPAVRHVDGVTVPIEIHRDAFDPIVGVSLEVRERSNRAMVFDVPGTPGARLASGRDAVASVSSLCEPAAQVPDDLGGRYRGVR